MAKRGVYFLANDRVSELARAFLNSFRFHNPDLPLVLIPFDANTGAIEKLQDDYGFSIFRNETLLRRFDEISHTFYPRTVGEFRKMAAWFGDFDEFIYIDVDTTLTAPLDTVFPHLDEYPLLNSHSNIPAIRQFTWRDSIFAANLLTEEQIAYSANMGFFASKKGVFDLPDIEHAVCHSARAIPHMESMCTDQPFMNFLFVTSGKKHTSLHVLREFRGDESIPHEMWAGDLKWTVSDLRTFAYEGRQRNVLFVHWAGEWAAKAEDFAEWEMAVSKGIQVPRPTLRASMPQKALWQHYRYLTVPSLNARRAVAPSALSEPFLA